MTETEDTPLQRRLAQAFTRLLYEEIGPDNMAAVVRLSELQDEDDDSCPSHDFCDANMVMDDAFTTLGLRAPINFKDGTPEHEQACQLWSEAWEIARREYFPLYRDPSLAPPPANDE